MTSWTRLGVVEPRDLRVARLASHYAAQPMAAAAYAVLPMREDHSHTNLLWSGEQERFLGRALPAGSRCFLDLRGLRTGLVDPGGREIAGIDLTGITLEEAFAVMGSALLVAGEEVPSEGLGLPAYDLPASPLAEGATFPAPESPSFEELVRWFQNGAGVLERLASTHLAGAALVGWPHHFDMAALLTLDPDSDPEAARSIGIGLSPGDGSYPEPYFYVSPWPAPPPEELPELGGLARWHTEGFTSAVVVGSEIVTAPDAEAQRTRVEDALRSSVEACKRLLET